jgi:hypothetical protein
VGKSGGLLSCSSSGPPESHEFAGRCQNSPSRHLAIVVRLRRVSSPSVTVGQPLSAEVPGERTREDRLDSRLRLTWLAAIRDGEGLARKTISPTCAQPKAPGWTIQPHHVSGSAPDRAAGNRGARLALLSCQVAKTRRIGSAAAKCSNQTDLHLTFIDPI